MSDEPSTHARSRQWRLAAGLLLIALNAAAYAPLWNAGFINMDDPLYVSGNPHVRNGISAAGITWAFTSSHDANWIPLTWISLMVDAEIHGGQPRGYHVTNVVLHTLASILLLAALIELGLTLGTSTFVAAMFAVHPLHVESVAWIAERKDVLSALFGVIALWAYARWCHGARWGYGVAIAAFVLSLVSKQMLVTLPFVLLILDHWPLRRIEASGGCQAPENSSGKTFRQLVTEKLPFFAISLLFCVIVFLVQRAGGAVKSLEHVPLATRFANALAAYGLYLWKTIWPTDLAVYYPHPSGGVPAIEIAIGASILIGVTLAAFLLRARLPGLLFGWLWYLGTLVPVIGLVQIGSQRMADRYTYLPLIGIFIAIAVVARAIVPARRVLLPLLGTVLIVAAAGRSYQQSQYWRSSETLFRHALAVTRDNAVAHANLGDALLAAGKAREAIEQFREAIRIVPDFAVAHTNLGIALFREGDTDAALKHFEQAIAAAPGSASAQFNYGATLQKLGNVADAEKHYALAVRSDPSYVDARIALASLMRERNAPTEAAEHDRAAIELDPGNASAHMGLGLSMFGLGRREEGLKHLLTAAEREPDSAVILHNLGAALLAVGDPAKAITYLERALAVDRSNTAAIEALAGAYQARGAQFANQGQMDVATADFRKAVDLTPKAPRAHFNLAQILLLQQQTDEAEKALRTALELDPDFAEAHSALGRILLQRNAKEEAAKHFRETLRIRPDDVEAQRNLQSAEG